MVLPVLPQVIRSSGSSWKLIVLTLFALLPLSGWAQTGTYVFTLTSPGNDGTVPSPQPTGGTFNAFTRSNAAAPGSASSGVYSFNVTNNTASVNTSNYVEVSFTVAAGYQYVFDKLTFNNSGSAASPNLLEVRASKDNFASVAASQSGIAVSTTSTSRTFDPADFTVAAGQTLRIRFYSYGTGRADGTASASASTGNHRLNNVAFFGTLSTVSSSPSVTISSSGPAAANVAPSATNVLLYALNLNVTNGPTTLSGLSLTTAGTYTATDLQNNFRLYYSADAVYDGTDVAAGTAALAGTGSTLSFSPSQSVASGSANYLLLVTDIAAAPVSGHTIGIASTAASAVTFSTAGTTVSGTANAGGLQTVVVPAPEINVKQGSTGIATAGTYNFGSVGLGSTSDVVFTIENTGTSNLILSAATLGGTGFTLQSNYSSPVAASGTTSFTIRFTPSAIGASSGSISIPSNDGDENPYVINFSGTGTPSTQSDIILNSGFTYSSNIDYTQYSVSTITSTSNSVGVMGFIVRDGGGSTDADALPTILNSITFDVTGTSTGIGNILSAALFNGNALVSNTPTISTGAGTIAFSGLSGANVTAADNGQATLTLRVSFKQTAGGVTDNEQLTFTISAANVAAAGSNTSSLFNPAFASVVSSTTGDRNRIEVTASTIAYGTQPANGEPLVNLSAFTLKAVDAKGNTDLDESACQVVLSTTGTGFTSSASYTFANGLITVSNAQYNAAQNNISLTATAQSCLGSNAVTSGLFSIISFGAVTGDYRSTGSGTLSTTGIWEQLTGSGWVAIAGAPPAATTSTIFIQHAISGGGSFTREKVTVLSGGTFTISASSTVSSLLRVRDGGLLQVNANLNISSTATFRVDDGGQVNMNFAFGTPATSIWNGTELFEANSTFRFTDWDSTDDLLTTNAVVTSNTFNGYAAAFGNLVFDFGTNVINNWDLLSTGITVNLAHGNLEFKSIVSGNSIRPTSSGTQTSGINGNLIVDSTYPGVVQFKSSGTLNFTVAGNYQQAAGTVRFLAASSGTSVVTINGSMTITGGTTDMNSTNAAAAVTTLNLKGNLTVSSPGSLTNSNLNGADAGTVTFNFAGTTVQQVNVATTVANIPFRVLSGATAQLAANLTVNRSTMAFIVRTGGILDFNGFTFLGTSGFTQEAGATLKITSAQGIDATGATGNVQSSASGRNFNNAGIYHYTGTVAQVTGTGLNPAAGQKVLIIDNPVSVTLSQTVNISSTGGGIDIRQGIFQGSGAAFVSVSSSTNSVYLTMLAGTTYRISALTTSLPAGNQHLPQAGGTFTLDPSSLIEMIGAGDQILRGSKAYGSLTFGGSGTKTLSSSVGSVAGTVTIQGASTIVDVQGNALGGSGTNFTMTAGRFRTSRTTDTQPNMTGTYALTGGVVEYYGTSAVTSQTIRGAKTYFDVEISADAANTAAYNVLNGSGNITVGGEFRIKSNAVYQIGANLFIVGTSAAAGTFVMEAGSTLKYGDSNGITLQSCGTTASCGNIRTPFRTFPTTASYGFVNTATMASGNGLPSSVVNLYLQKTSASTVVTLTNPVTVTGVAEFTSGALAIGTNLLTLSGTAAGTGNGTITGSATSTILVNGTGTLGTIYFTSGARELQNLTLNRTGSGSATIGTDLTIGNSLTLSDGTLNIGAGTVLTLNGTVNQTSGNLGGTATSDLVINGSGALGSSLLFSPTAANLQNLTLNRSGSKVVLGSQLSIFGNVSFTNGLLETASGTELVFEDNATQTGAGLLSHIVGPAVKVGNEAFIFPLGTDTLYAPLAISAPAAATERFRAQYFYASAQDGLSDSVATPLVRVSDIEYWQLQQLAGSSLVKVTLSWSNSRLSGVNNLNALRVARFVGPEWVNEGNSGTAGTAANGTIESGAVNGYGYFSLASADPALNPLPVELISFTGSWINNEAVLEWITASEKEASGFVIERSHDGKTYHAIGEVPAAGNSALQNNYSYADAAPMAGLNYYRLKQLDADNSFRYFGPVVLWNENREKNEPVLFPNPAVSTVMVQFYIAQPETISIQVLDITGSQKFVQQVSAKKGLNQQPMDIANLAKGAYLIKVQTSSGSTISKLIKE